MNLLLPLAGVLYLVLGRLLFAAPGLRRFLDPLCAGFMFALPFAGGALAVHTADTLSWTVAVLLPGLTAVLGLGVQQLLGLHRLLSTVLVLPAYLAMAFAGGLFVRFLTAFEVAAPALGILVVTLTLIPFVLAAVEGQLPVRTVGRWVRTTRRLRARPEDIWDNVVRVAPIRPNEWGPYRLFALAQFPTPERAVLSGDGLGELRQGIFSGQVLFDEPVVAWEPGRRVRFDVHVRPEALTALPFDEFTRLGGRYFDVLQAEYRLEPAGPEYVLVHLDSQYRLSSRLNRYAGWWAKLILGAFQRSILAVVARRCERPAENAEFATLSTSSVWGDSVVRA